MKRQPPRQPLNRKFLIFMKSTNCRSFTNGWMIHFVAPSFKPRSQPGILRKLKKGSNCLKQKPDTESPPKPPHRRKKHPQSNPTNPLVVVPCGPRHPLHRRRYYPCAHRTPGESAVRPWCRFRQRGRRWFRPACWTAWCRRRWSPTAWERGVIHCIGIIVLFRPAQGKTELQRSMAKNRPTDGCRARSMASRSPPSPDWSKPSSCTCDRDSESPPRSVRCDEKRGRRRRIHHTSIEPLRVVPT